ncbi:hypothetical protein [Streptosporangium sp. KLBMP 9127]|nr:hypothetical protein [Streptosporangium sp. KLBMP 9127]
MTVIGIVVLGLGMVVAVLCAMADQVLLSRINGGPAAGPSGRYLGEREADIVRLPIHEDRRSSAA